MFQTAKEKLRLWMLENGSHLEPLMIDGQCAGAVHKDSVGRLKESMAPASPAMMRPPSTEHAKQLADAFELLLNETDDDDPSKGAVADAYETYRSLTPSDDNIVWVYATHNANAHPITGTVTIGGEQYDARVLPMTEGALSPTPADAPDRITVIWEHAILRRVGRGPEVHYAVPMQTMLCDIATVTVEHGDGEG